MKNEELYEQLIREVGIIKLSEFIGYAHERIIDSVRFNRTFGKLTDGTGSKFDSIPTQKALDVINKKLSFLVWEKKLNAEVLFSKSLSFEDQLIQFVILERLFLNYLREKQIYDPDYSPNEDSDDIDYLRIERSNIAKGLIDKFAQIRRMLEDEESNSRSQTKPDILDNSSNCGACDSNPCVCSDPFKTSAFR